MILQKTNNPSYSKDKTSGVVINTAQSELSAYQKQKQAILDKKRLEAEVKDLKKELEDQRKMIQAVLLEMGILKN